MQAVAILAARENTVSMNEPAAQLPIGTRIRFTQTLECDANEDHPAFTYAIKGDLGEITGHGCREGYWVKWEHWPTPFGASREEFEPL
jgi:hypothetical protein